MKPETREKLDAILKYPWFQSCGQPIPRDVTAVANWNTAAKECSRAKWGNCQLMAANALAQQAESRSWERRQEWNPLAVELRQVIDPFIDRVLPEVPVPEDVIRKVKATVAWDILHACFEHHYQDIVHPIFYIPYLDPWYSAGHFPCGWDGEEFPPHWDGVVRDGRLMVF